MKRTGRICNPLVDISKDTNLAVSAPITLTDDTIGFDPTSPFFDIITWGSGVSVEVWTFDVSGTNPEISFSDELIDFASAVNITEDLRVEGDVDIDQNLALNDLTGPSGLYLNVNSEVVTDIPTSGNLGYWNRTGDVLTTANAGDDVELGGDLDVDGTINLAYLGCVGTGNYFLGDIDTLSSVTTGFNNLAFGAEASASLEDGVQNVTLGWQAGFANISGNSNMFIGALSGFSCLSSSNVGIGFRSLSEALGGLGLNVAIGNQALRGSGATKTFNNNIAIGADAGLKMDTGIQNTLIGKSSGSGLTTGSINTLIGSEAGKALTTHGSNVMIGYASGLSNAGSSNIFIGFLSGRRQTTANNVLLVDNFDRSSAANELIASLLYGTASATVANQTFRINAQTEIGNTTTRQPLTVRGDLTVDGSTTLGDDAAVDLVTVNARLIGNGGRQVNLTEDLDATTAIAATDDHISIQYTDTGTNTVTLPAISASNHGQEYHVKDADYNASVNNITVNTTGSDTIEDETDGLITQDGECWTVIANNTTKNWEVQ